MSQFAKIIAAVNEAGQLVDNHSHAHPFKKGGIARFTLNNGERERICLVMENCVHSINLIGFNNDGNPALTTNAWLTMTHRANKENFIEVFDKEVLPGLTVDGTKLEEIHWFDFTA